MSTRAFFVSAAALAFLAVSAAPVPADDCHASATFKDVTKTPGQRGSNTGTRVGNTNPRRNPPPGFESKVAGTPDVYELHFDVEVSGCADSPGRPNKFGKAAYGTITYTFHKKYIGLVSGEADDKSTANWSDQSKGIAVTGKLEGKDTKGFFEASNIQIERTVCGCR